MNKAKQILFPIGVLFVLIGLSVLFITAISEFITGIKNSMYMSSHQDVKAATEITQELSNVCYTTNSEICD